MLDERALWRRSVAAAPLLLALGAACAPLRAQGPPRPGGLLAPERVAALPAGERAAWKVYLARSAELMTRDRAALAAEVGAAGEATWTPAPYGESFSVEKDAGWFAGAEAARVAGVIVSYQAPSGGWSKHVELRGEARRPGQAWFADDDWHYAETFDNGATTEQLRFLGAVEAAQPAARWRASFLRGLEYVAAAQFPNGCYPQVYPVEGGYHDAATFNDDSMLHILRLLQAVARGEYPFVPAEARTAAAAAVERGVGCIVASQVVEGGRRTAWGAQHDPLTLVPVKARAYEHASLSGGESAGLLDFLLRLPDPDSAVVAAVHAAAAWFRETAIYDWRYEPKGELVAEAGAGPIWARFYELGTNRPIFSNRDGVVRYSWSELEPERRYGYGWYRTDAAKVLKRYDRWRAKHPPAGRPQ